MFDVSDLKEDADDTFTDIELPSDLSSNESSRHHSPQRPPNQVPRHHFIAVSFSDAVNCTFCLKKVS